MPVSTPPSRPQGGRRTQLVFGILLSGLMAFIFAGFIPFLALGFSAAWLKAWGTGIVIGWPLGFGIVSLVNRPIMRLAVRLTDRRVV